MERHIRSIFMNPQYVWVFRCSRRPCRHAATLQMDGANLPGIASGEEVFRWVGMFVVGPDNTAQFGIDVLALKVAIEEDGCYVWESHEELPQELYLWSRDPMTLA